MTPKGNPTPHNNPPNSVLNVPADPDSDPSLSDSPMSYPSDSSDGEYSKQRRCMKENKNNCQSKNSFNHPIKSAQSLQPR